MSKRKFTRYLFGTEQNEAYSEGLEYLKKYLKYNDAEPNIFSFEEGVTPSFKLAEAIDGWDKYGFMTEVDYQELTAENGKLILDKLLRVDGVWDFVATYYNGYSSANEIAEGDDLQKVVDGEINGCAVEDYKRFAERLGIDLKLTEEEEEKLFDVDFDYENRISKEDHQRIVEVAKMELDLCNVSIFEKTIEDFLEQINSLKIN